MAKAFPTADLHNIMNLDFTSAEMKEYFFEMYFRKISVDVCINGCMVYTGDYKYVEVCEFCNEPRYFNECLACFNQKIIGNCNHSNRNSRKSIEYRSIIWLIKDLIKLHPSFIDLVNYYDYGKKNDPQSLYYKDNTDGDSYLRNRNEMHSKFQRYKYTRGNTKLKIVQISLCLSWFYDGCQLYHHLIYAFLPMIFTILNLPPPLRHKLGIGTFLLSINTLSPGSYVEFFLLFDCFVQELIELYNGMSYVIDDTEYFIQSRLICSILDLPALCKVFFFSSMFNSIEGCVLCNWGRGVYNKYIKKVKYINSRLHLPLRHYLRSMGHKICKCKPDTENEQNISSCEEKKICKLWNKNVQQWLKLLDQDVKASGYIWYNQDIADIDEIGLSIRDEHAFELLEYRSSPPYKRYENQYYDRKATSAINKKKDAQSKSVIQKLAVNGIKGFSPLRALPYIRYDTDIIQDPAHVLFVLALMILNIWSCDKENYRMFKNGVKEFYKSFEFSNIFDCLWDNKIVVPWNFNKHEQMRVEAYLKCVLIPLGSNRKFHIVKGNIFKQKGIIKGSGKITLIAVYMNLILFGNLHMSIGYKALFRIFSNVFSRVKNKKILKTDLYPLFRRVNELRSFWEGYIPITEMIQMLHALEDIVTHIPKQGPIAGFNAMHGEQAIGNIKNLSHIKGSSRPELQAFRKAAQSEFETARQFYSNLDSDRSSLTGLSNIYWNSTASCYVYNSERTLFEGFSTDMVFNSEEFSCLLESFHRIIFQYYNCDIFQAISNSSFFRILHLARKSSTVKTGRNIINFFESFITKYDNIILQCNNIIQQPKRLEQLKIFESLQIVASSVGIIQSDVVTIKQVLNLKNKVFTIYERILLPFSMKLRGRGFQYSKNNDDDNRNNLENFYRNDQYSSWCKIKSLKSPIEAHNDTNEFYGQANYFFQLNIPEFPDYFILKNRKFASIVSYTYKFNKILDVMILKNLHEDDTLSHSHLNTINIKNGISENYKDSNPSFITSDEILSTEVLIFGFIQRGYLCKVIYPYHDFKSPQLEEYVQHKQNFIISLGDEIWQWKENWYLAFLDGSPENLINKESDSVLEDVKDEESFWTFISENKYKYFKF